MPLKRDLGEITSGMVEHLTKPSQMIARVGERATALKERVLGTPKKDRGDIRLLSAKEKEAERALAKRQRDFMHRNARGGRR